MALEWVKRPHSLIPLGLFAPGEPDRLLNWAEPGPGWALFKTAEGFLLRAPEAELPWVQGAIYLGQDPEWPGLLVPTQWQPRHARQILFIKALHSQGWTGVQALLPPNRLLSLARSQEWP